jgi:hypothetical protein
MTASTSTKASFTTMPAASSSRPGPTRCADSGGIDIDPVLQIPGLPDADHPPAGRVSVINEGYIEGPRAIVSALDSVAPIDIANTGTLFGRSGVAIDLAPGQGDTMIALSGGSRILGDILFGAGGQNTLHLGQFDTGADMAGRVGARTAEDLTAGLSDFAALSGGFDLQFDEAVSLADFGRFGLGDNRLSLEMRAGVGRLRFDLFGVRDVDFGGARYDARQFAALLSDNGIAPIPLPAGAWLLLGGSARWSPCAVAARRKGGQGTRTRRPASPCLPPRQADAVPAASARTRLLSVSDFI